MAQDRQRHQQLQQRFVLGNLRRFHAEVDVTELLPRISCPVLLIHSRGDRVHPLEEARRCAALIPDAELVVLETANHVPNPHLPVWDSYVAVLTEFLGRDAPPGP